MKYIDADKLIAEIKTRKNAEGWCTVGSDTADVYYARGFRFACEFVLDTLASLQQEQPEVDLEKEFEKYMSSKDESGFVLNRAGFTNPQTAYKLARYFYELGLKARKEG